MKKLHYYLQWLPAVFLIALFGTVFYSELHGAFGTWKTSRKMVYMFGIFLFFYLVWWPLYKGLMRKVRNEIIHGGFDPYR